MNVEWQHTVASAVSYSGIALHTGVRANLMIKPAPVDTGICFCRVDVDGKPAVQALGTNVVGVQRGTTIKSGEAVVHTVEHVMAALNAFGIDNAIVEMDDAEPPIADGSSKPFTDLLEKVGSVAQDKPRRYYVIKEPVEMEMGVAKIRMEPSDDFEIFCKVQYNETVLDDQEYSVTVDRDSFVKELSEARTFCLYREIEGLMAAGLIKGGSLDNAVVLHQGVILSKDGLRYPDEQVRHKMLDIVGDFYLLGAPLKGRVIAEKPGHPSNVTMVQKLLSEHPDWFVESGQG